MRRPARNLRAILAILWALSSSFGCATFTDLPPAAPRIREPAEAGRDLSVFVVRGNDPNRRDGYWMPYPAEDQIDVAFDALRESVPGVPVVESNVEDGSDWTLRVERWRHFQPSGIFTILTAGLIPARLHLRLIVKMTRDQDGDLPKTCVQIHRYQQWVQLFLLPWMASHSLGRHEDAAVGRMTARCAHELLAERTSPRDSE